MLRPVMSGSVDTAGDTPLQAAMRLNGVAMFLLLIGLTPLLHLYWHLLRGRAEPMLPGNAAVAAPQLDQASLWDGKGQAALETWLKEDSPEVWWLRGTYNELRWHCGLLQTPEVLVGRDGWLFLRSSLGPDAAQLAAEAPRRQALFAAVAAEARALGIALVAVVVPDKARIHPEFAYPDGVLPAAKAPLYADLLAELRQAGIEAVDLAAPLLAAKAAGAPPLYHPMDTHWYDTAALLAMQTAAAALQQRHGDRLGAAWRMQLTGPARAEVLPDLVGLLGLCSTRRLRAERQQWVPWPASATTLSLLESVDYHGVAAAADGGPLRPQQEFAAEAQVLLAGSSFSQNGGPALAYALRRPVDVRPVQTGASALQSLRDAFALLRNGDSRAGIVVWEFVERAATEDLGRTDW